MKYFRLPSERTLALVGSVALSLAVGVAFVPSVAAVFRPIAGVAGPAAVLLFGGVAGLLGLWSLRQTVADERDEETDFWTPVQTPERAHYDEHRTTGTEVDRVLDGDETDANARKRANERMLRTAVSVVADADNCSRQTARTRLDAGTWTGDPRAAAFFAGDRTRVPLRTRVRDWASGESYERWARHAVAEVEALAADKSPGAETETATRTETETETETGERVPKSSPARRRGRDATRHATRDIDDRETPDAETANPDADEPSAVASREGRR